MAVTTGSALRDGITLWIYDVQRGVPNRLAIGAVPVWSPDGRRIAYGAPGYRVVVRNADGSDNEETIAESGTPMDWSGDGRSCLLFPGGGGSRAARIVTLAAPRVARTLFEPTAPTTDGRFSPDGRWIAFTSRELGAPEVFVAPVDRGSARQRVSVGGATNPCRVKNGSELVYLSNRRVKAVSMKSGTTGGDMTIGAAQTLFTFPENTTVTSFDVTRDGSRFLLLASDATTNRTSIRVTTNWLAQVSARRQERLAIHRRQAARKALNRCHATAIERSPS